MLSKPISENKNCWQRGMVQPLGMCAGSTINLAGGVASLVLSVQTHAVNPLPFICTSMLTSSLYVISNSYRAYQLWTEKPKDLEGEKPPLSFEDKIKRERVTITIER